MTKINVTQNHIDRGVRGCSTKCPVALAILDQTEDCYCGVFDKIMSFDNYEIDTPASVKRFIHQFDIGMKVKPFKFKLKIK